MDDNQTFKVINDDPLQSPVAKTENPLNTGNGTPTESTPETKEKTEGPHEINIGTLDKKDNAVFPMGTPQSSVVQKKSSYLMPIIIVVVVLALGGGGFFAYKTYFSTSKTTPTEEKTETPAEKPAETPEKIEEPVAPPSIDLGDNTEPTSPENEESNLGKAILEKMGNQNDDKEVVAEEQPSSSSTKVPRH